jgi:hypothetical protein
MNNRQFAAAHDSYLEPPEYDDDGEETWDECDLADIEQQRRIDHEDWQAESLRQKQEDRQ